MNDDNPYAAPQADLEFTQVVKTPQQLADRSTRLASAILDGIIGWVIAVPVFYLLGLWSYVSKGQNPPVGLLIASVVIGFAGFLLIHGYLLKTKGQTVGKYLTGIRITDLDGNLPDFGKLVLLRYLPVQLVTLVPLVGAYVPLLDVLFIFRGDRRCLHDLIAGTRVFVVSPEH